MLPSEFKAWFEGFTESVDGPPSLKQWERIQARVKEISGSPVTERHYIDRYWPTVRPLYPSPAVPYWSANGIGVCNTLNASSCDGKVGHVAFATGVSKGNGGTVFDSHAAMNALGKADAALLAA